MPTTAEPPAAPSTAPIIQEDTRPVINVSQLPKDSIPSKPPKPGSARARMYEEMQKKFGGESPSTKTANGPSTTRAKAPEASPAKEPVEAETPGAGVTAPPAPPETTAGQEDASTTPAAAPTVAEAEKGKKVSPWKLVDQFKERATKAESRLLEVEKQIIPEEQRKAAEAQLQQLQSENKEMREELRFHQAEKYDPDVIKSKEEYNRAFNRADESGIVWGGHRFVQ